MLGPSRLVATLRAADFKQLASSRMCGQFAAINKPLLAGQELLDTLRRHAIIKLDPDEPTLAEADRANPAVC